MDSSSRMRQLLEARESLTETLKRSKEVGEALERTGPRLEQIRQRLPELEKAVSPMRESSDVLADIGDQIDRAVGPAAALLRVFDAVHGFEKPLLGDPRAGIQGYLELVRRLEQALKLLAENCGEATQWLEDIVEYLETHNVGRKSYLRTLRRSLEGLKDLQIEEEKARLDGGLLDAALDRLLEAFRKLLTENTVVLPPSESGCERPRIAPSPLPGPVVQELQVILERLTVNGRLEQCLAVYIEVRGANAQASLKALQLDYLQKQFNSASEVLKEIEKWVQHLEFFIRHLLEAEYKLCGEVYEKIGSDVCLGCFAEIAVRAGILDFLKFADMVAKAKPDPIKLLKLLDIFNCLYNLRPDFNKLFADKSCLEIRNRTSELVKSVIEGACEIFRQFMTQVELQRHRPPPVDGGVPLLVSFLVDYCNQLLGDPYQAILTQVLVIERSWRREAYQERILTNGIKDIIRALEQNIETWSKDYDDEILSHLFLMNNNWYFYVHSKGTRLGNLLHSAWLKEREQYKEYYAEVYHRESWAKLPALLSKEGLILFSGGRATARDLLKQRLKAFNTAFDDLYRRHAKWVIPDKELREKTCHKIVQSLVPSYRSYIQSYGALVEQEGSPKRHVKYTAEDLERMIYGLFKDGSGKPAYNGTGKISRTASLATGNNGLNRNSQASLSAVV